MYVFLSFSVFAHALNIAFESTLDQRPTTSSLSVKSCLLHIFSANVLAPLIVMHFVTIKDLWHLFQIPYDQEQSLQRCSFKKMFWKYSENLQENTHTKVWFQQLKSLFGIGVVLLICCVFTGHFFRKDTTGELLLGTVLKNMPAIINYKLSFKKLRCSNLHNIYYQ